MTGQPWRRGTPKPGLAREPVRVIIRTDSTGQITVAVYGPIKGKAGLLALLDAAKRIAQNMTEHPEQN